MKCIYVMLAVYFIFVSWFAVPAIGKFYKTNMTDFSKCKVHYSRSGSTYRDFYEIADEARENDTLLDFHFSVLAPSDAHILLAPSSNIYRGDPVYEIVIGAGGNTFSDIRREQKSAVKASSRVKGLLSALDVRSFWVHISKEGLIEVGRDGEELAFLVWRDPDPLPLKVFSFSTWPGVEAKWFFDCPRNNTNTTNSKEVEKNLTDLQCLRRDLLHYYDPYVRPNLDGSDIAISMIMSLYYINLNERRSIVEVKGVTKMIWQDQKLKWDPLNYGDIKTLHIYGREIWQPDIFLHNAVGSGRDILGDTMLVANYKGFVEWNPRIQMVAWCNVTDLNHWPVDIHNVRFLLGLGKDWNNVQLQFEGNSSNLLGKHYTTEWEVMEVEVVTIDELEKNSTVQIFYPPSLDIRFKIRRSSDAYTSIFFTPFYVISVILLSSFWISPFGYLKISLGCLSLILCSVLLIALGYFIPSHPNNVPYLLFLYNYSLIASILNIIISIIVINITRSTHNYSLPRILKIILTSCMGKFILVLPSTKMSKQYGNLNEVSISKTTENLQDFWILLGTAVDRIAFYVYLVLCATAFCLKY